MQSRTYLSLFAGFVWLSLAIADPIELRTSDGQTVVTYHGIQFQQLDAKHSRYLLTGGVNAKFKKTSVTITSDRATVLAQTEATTELTSILATGDVKLVKTEHRKTGIVTSTLSSNQIQYFNGKTGSSAVCKSAVVLTQSDPSNRLNLHATGGSGEATFLGGADSKNNRLTSATLHSPVDIKIDQAPVAGKKSKQAHITCSQMVYKPTLTDGTLDLSGHIQIESTQGTVSHLSHALVHLTEKNELKDYEGSGGN